MAEVVIRLKDTNDGNVDISADFDPPFPGLNRIEEATNAQMEAIQMLDAVAGGDSGNDVLSMKVSQ